MRYVVSEHGYRRQDPLPSDDELQRFYADTYFQDGLGQYQEAYDDEELAWLDLEAAVADSLVHAVGTDAPRTLIDIGCGEGFLMAGLARRGWSVAGCDFSSYGIRRWNPELLQRFDHGNVFELLEEYSGRERRFGLVNLSNVLEHVPDPEKLLQGLTNLVSPNGLLRINVPNDFSDLQRLLVERGSVQREYWTIPMQHLNYFDRDSLTSTVEACGWTVSRLLSDFPIEHFLLHPGSNYVENAPAGRAAHRARVTLDLHYSRDLDSYTRLLEAQAACGMGRSLIAFLRPAAS
jgi:SAM-dependent methyltransferase